MLNNHSLGSLFVVLCMKIRYLLFVLTITLFVSCKKETNSINVLAQPEIAIDNPDFKEVQKEDYSIRVHKDWLIELHPQDEIDLYIYIDTEDDFVENINLIVHQVDHEKITLDQVAKSVEAEFSAQGKIISSQKIITPYREYQRMIVTSRLYGENLKFIQHFFLKNSKIYILTFTALEIDFNKYEKIAEQIMQSFKVK